MIFTRSAANAESLSRLAPRNITDKKPNNLSKQLDATINSSSGENDRACSDQSSKFNVETGAVNFKPGTLNRTLNFERLHELHLRLRENKPADHEASSENCLLKWLHGW